METELNNPSTRICEIDDIALLGSRVIQRKTGSIGVFRTTAESVFALLDGCPHKGGPVSQGIVHGNIVTCPLHSWQIALVNGETKAPDVGCARHFPVNVESGQAFLALT